MNSKIYIVNVVVCVSVVIFCGIKVMLDPQPTTTSIYLPIMSGIVGYFVPSPKKEKSSNESSDNNSLISRLSQRLMGGNREVKREDPLSNPTSSASSDSVEV